MGRVQTFMKSLHASDITQPKTQFNQLERFANQLEQELAQNKLPRRHSPRWVHCSERLPTSSRQVIAVIYCLKSDGKELQALNFDGEAFVMRHPDTYVAYWLEGLEMPESRGNGSGGRAVSIPSAADAKPSRVERFIATLPTFRVGPKTRVRFLESFASYLEEEISALTLPIPPPRWIDCRDREPQQPGKYISVVRLPMSDGVELDALPYANGVFSSSIADTLVFYWLEGLPYPPFYHQPSNALNPLPRSAKP